MSDQLPQAPRADGPDKQTPPDGRYLRIDQYNDYGNDIAALAELAKIDKGLAEKFIDKSDKADHRAHISERFGLASTVILLGVLIAGFVAIIIFGGVFDALILIAAILALSLLVRVVLTGEWSETTWFGKIVELLVAGLGGKKPQNESDEAEDP